LLCETLAGEGGIPPHPSRSSASRRINSAPAALLVQSRTQQKSFPFLLEEKIGARKLKNVKKTFLRGGDPPAGGERRRGGASKFAVRILLKESSDFVQQDRQIRFVGR